MPYYDEDRLIYSKTDDGHKKVKTEVRCNKKRRNARGRQRYRKRWEDSSGESETGDSGSREAAYVAERIRLLIDEGYRPKDITILLRSAKNNARIFETELEKLNFPYYNGCDARFL